MELEKMDEFFDNRLAEYDSHQLNCIDSAKVFYPFTASLLPTFENCKILDLGCGTGLELEEYFKLNPNANVTGIDLATGMLKTLKTKFPNKKLTLINESYFDFPFGENIYDAAVSVESLHHFTKDQKVPLYKKLLTSLKEKGYFILTDYFAENESIETENFSKLSQIKKELGINDNDFYHYDTPLTIGHEIKSLQLGGFTKIEILNQWGPTATIKASK